MGLCLTAVSLPPLIASWSTSPDLRDLLRFILTATAACFAGAASL